MNIQQLFQDAKEDILKNGKHAPTLYVESEDTSLTMIYFADLPEMTREKQYTLFGLGRKQGKEQSNTSLLNLYLLTEAWVSNEPYTYDAPSDDPNRKEVLMALHFDAKTGKSSMHRAEMIRSKDGTLIDLLTMDDIVIGVEDRILPYFLAGFLSAKMSDAELAQHLTGQK